jgi:hypothetical protein
MQDKNLRRWVSEEEQWRNFSPRKRFRQYQTLLDYYIRAGGRLQPEKDSQSPFDFREYYKVGRGVPRPAKSGNHSVCGVGNTSHL